MGRVERSSVQAGTVLGRVEGLILPIREKAWLAFLNYPIP